MLLFSCIFEQIFTLHYYLIEITVVFLFIFVLQLRLEQAKVEEGGEEVEEDLADSGRADELVQCDVMETLTNISQYYCFC